MKRTIPRAHAVALAGALAMLLPAAAAGATNDYGPAPVTHPSVPGGFSQIAASATRGPDGGTITGQIGTAVVRVTGAPGTLAIPLQVTLRAPSLEQLRQHLAGAGIRGTVRAAVALSAAKQDGTPIHGRLSSRHLSLTLRAADIRPGDRVFRWSPSDGRFVPIPLSRVAVSRGALTVRFNRGQELIVLGPARSH